MVEIEETEYRTVEEEVTRFKCERDGCGRIVDEDEIHTIAVIRGDAERTTRVRDRSVDTEHRCENCCGAHEAYDISRSYNRAEKYLSPIVGTFHGAFAFWEWDMPPGALVILIPVFGAFISAVLFLGFVSGDIHPADDTDAMVVFMVGVMAQASWVVLLLVLL